MGVLKLFMLFARFIIIVHFLIDCSQFSRVKVIMGGPDQLNLKILLWDIFNHAKLLSFLKSVDFFGQI